ncbi:MAG TPA: hypothetical protein VI685_01180 [Candidatus Angelobacter sp.]
MSKFAKFPASLFVVVALSTLSWSGICGTPNDQAIHIPPNYTTFAAPAAGSGYVDPVFGCTVTRISNSATEETLPDGNHASMMTYYSTFAAINATDTLLFVYSDDGQWRIKDLNGNLVVAAGNMPNTSNTNNSMNNGHPVWDASNGNVFYFTNGNTLYKGTISGSSVTNTVVHTFTEYAQGVNSTDSADLSQDGNHIALVGQNANNTLDIFVWAFGNPGSKTSVYTTTCTISGNVVDTPQPGCVHKLQLTANNLLTIEFVNDGTNAEEGLRLWDGSSLTHLQDVTSHYDTGYDLNSNSIFTERGNSSSLSTLTNPCPSKWGLDVRNLNNLNSASCLLDHQPDWHISYRGSASQPWIAISFWDSTPPTQLSPELYNNDPNFEAPTTSNWALYQDEIVLARVDGSQVYRLAHARSRSATGYWAQPHAAISRSGNYVVFTSNMAHPNGCPANMHVAGECSDVYVIRVQSASSLAISPASATVNAGGSQTFAASGGASPYTFSFVTNHSGGTINATTGLYSAGCTGGVTDTVRVTDHAGNTSDAAVTVNNSSSSISFVQQVSPGYVTAASGQAAITETAGNLLVVAVYWNSDAAAISVSDTLGNTYLSTPQVNFAGGGFGTQVQIFYAQNIAGGSNTVTVTQSTTTHALGFYLLEYSGIQTSNALDATAGQVAPGNTSVMTTGNLVTAGCKDLVVGLFNDTSFASGAITAGAGFTGRTTDTAFISSTEDDVPGVGQGSLNVSANLPSATSSWAATAAAFKAK